MGGDRWRRFPRATGDATDPPRGLDRDPGDLRRRVARAPQVSRRPGPGERLAHRVGPVEWKEMPTRFDDLDRGVAKLALEDLCPAWLQEGIVRAPENQGGRLDLFDVLRTADQVAIVERSRRSQVRPAAAEVLVGSRPLANHLIGDAPCRNHPGLESLAQTLTHVDVEHALISLRR